MDSACCRLLARRMGKSKSAAVPRAGWRRLSLSYDAARRPRSTKDLVYALSSTDQGHTWSTPTTVFPQPGLYTGSRLWCPRRVAVPVVPLSGRQHYLECTESHSYVEMSADSGVTWKECDVQGSSGFVQMNIIPLSQDHLIAFFRERYADWIYKWESNDGCAWTTPQATRLQNNPSIQAIRLKNGHLLMIFNNSQAQLKPRARRYRFAQHFLHCHIKDDGKTWPWIRDLQNPKISQPILPLEDPEYSYPSLTQSADGMIHVAYPSAARRSNT